jgi:nucleoside-diphosphate-sugar epimerase
MDKSAGRDKILVVGSAGNIGSRVSKQLVLQGKRVVGIDNISTGSLSNIEDLYNLNNFEFIRGNIADLGIPAGVGTILFLARPDKRSHEDCIVTNVDGLHNCIDYCEKNDAKILYASTPVALSPIDPSQISNTFYVSRHLGESMVRSFHDKTGLGSMILRMPQVYGGDLDVSSMVYRFCHEAAKKGSISVFKDPNSSRAYLHTQDAVASLTEAVTAVSDNTFHVVDLNGSEVLTAKDLADKVEKYFDTIGQDCAILMKSRRYSHKRAVVSRAVSPLETTPRIKIDSCLEGIVQRISNEL